MADMNIGSKKMNMLVRESIELFKRLYFIYLKERKKNNT